jgi:hypothetical protein
MSLSRRVTGDGSIRVFFGILEIDLIRLETDNFFDNFFVEVIKDPSSRANSGSLEDEAEADNKVDQRVGQEGNRKWRSNDTPCQGSNNSRDDSSKETRVEEVLEALADTENGILISISINIKGGDTRNNEHAASHTDLVTNQGSLQVLTTGGKLTVGVSNRVLFEVFLGEIDNSEQSNLHTLHHADEAHEDEENNNRNNFRDATPHRCLTIEERNQCNRECETQDGKRHDNAGPEEEVLDGAARGLFRLDRLASDLGENDLDQVDAVQKAGHFNGKWYVRSEQHEVVVQEVKHAVGSVNLSSDKFLVSKDSNHYQKYWINEDVSALVKEEYYNASTKR